MSELKVSPCPFCGSEKDVDIDGWSDDQGNSGPECLNCGGTARSIEFWNARADRSVTGDIEKIKAISELSRAKIEIYKMKYNDYSWHCFLSQDDRDSLLKTIELIDVELKGLAND